MMNVLYACIMMMVIGTCCFMFIKISERAETSSYLSPNKSTTTYSVDTSGKLIKWV